MFGQLQDKFTKIFKVIKGHGKISMFKMSEFYPNLSNIFSFSRSIIILNFLNFGALFAVASYKIQVIESKQIITELL